MHPLSVVDRNAARRLVRFFRLLLGDPRLVVGIGHPALLPRSWHVAEVTFVESLILAVVQVNRRPRFLSLPQPRNLAPPRTPSLSQLGGSQIPWSTASCEVPPKRQSASIMLTPVGPAAAAAAAVAAVTS